MAMPISLRGYPPFLSIERAREGLRAAASVSVKRPAQIRQPESDAFVPDAYAEIDVEMDASERTCWCWMDPKGPPSFTPGLLRDISAHQRAIRQSFADARAGGEAPLKHWVLASRLPGIFNLGGDLDLFSGWIRAGNRDALRHYAYACIDVLHENAVGFDQPVITIALVQGDALGGGFEAALSCDMIVAERGAKFGFPEILFNLFPGMGAYSLLARRIGMAQAEKMIMSGKLYTAEELQALGLVQALADPGEGVAETHRLLVRNQRRHNGLSALMRAGRIVSPLPHDELRQITDVWVEAALGIEDGDLRKMERLTAAQDRRLATLPTVAAE